MALKKYDSVGVIIGRFQIDELHEGHKELIELVLEKHTKVIVFLGVSKSLGTKKNPLDYPTRSKMLLDAYPDLIICPLADLRTDEEWSKNLDNLIRTISPVGQVILYGSRDSFIPYYKGKFKTYEVEHTKLDSATEKRREICQEVVASREFRMGSIYSTYQRFPSSMLTVDAAIVKIVEKSKCLMLVAKKPGESKYRFVGGFVDPTDNSSEDALIREVKEETSIELDHEDSIIFISNRKINDWRYKSEEDKIFTNFYLVKLKHDLIASPNDDISELHWIDISTLSEEDFVDEHQILYFDLVEYYTNTLELTRTNI